VQCTWGLAQFYLFEALGINDQDAVLRELEMFLLELGAGFSFIARQKRIQLDGEDFYIDLLFYNRKLKRLVAVELKQGSFRPEYKGQMELYLRWLAKYESEEAEGQPLGIILCAGASTRQIELLELDAVGIHVAEYLTVLPPQDVLERKLQNAISASSSPIREQNLNRYGRVTYMLGL
jgi:YhcG PDDEXK nuclease domain